MVSADRHAGGGAVGCAGEGVAKGTVLQAPNAHEASKEHGASVAALADRLLHHAQSCGELALQEAVAMLPALTLAPAAGHHMTRIHTSFAPPLAP